MKPKGDRKKNFIAQWKWRRKTAVAHVNIFITLGYTLYKSECFDKWATETCFPYSTVVFVLTNLLEKHKNICKSKGWPRSSPLWTLTNHYDYVWTRKGSKSWGFMLGVEDVEGDSSNLSEGFWWGVGWQCSTSQRKEVQSGVSLGSLGRSYVGETHGVEMFINSLWRHLHTKESSVMLQGLTMVI